MLVATLYFDNLIEVKMEERDVMGEKQRCLSIPMEINGIHRSWDNRIAMNLCVIPRRPNNRKETHFLSVQFYTDEKSKLITQKIKKLGFWERLKYFGVLKLVGKRRNFIATHNDFSTSLDDAINTEL